MDFYEEALKLIGKDKIYRDEPMKEHITFKVGGCADYYLKPGISQVGDVIALCKEAEIDYLVIGNGSNLLVADDGIRGVVIELCADASDVQCEGNTITASAGVKLATIAGIAAENGLGGFEFASGIPGTLGGAIIMNAGAYGGEIKDVLKEAKVLTAEGEEKWIDAGDLDLSYRHSNIVERGYVVLAGRIELPDSNTDEIRARMKELNSKRLEKQPLDYPSAGSTFKRPEGYFAAKLIEDANLKGVTVGGACVSEKHSGFIINKNDATASDVFGLMRLVRDAVFKTSGVVLEPEVKFVGEWHRTF